MGFFEAAWGDRFLSAAFCRQGKCLVEGSLLNERRSWEMAHLTCRSWYTWRIVPCIISSYIIYIYSNHRNDVQIKVAFIEAMEQPDELCDMCF